MQGIKYDAVSIWTTPRNNSVKYGMDIARRRLEQQRRGVMRELREQMSSRFGQIIFGLVSAQEESAEAEMPTTMVQ